MDSKVLVILEVSQKQAYIFGSNKLKDNIVNSAVIAWVTSSAFFTEEAGDLFSEKRNLVYAGGGHTILQFADVEKAREFVGRITEYVLKIYPGLELFARLHETDGEPTAEDLKILVEKLEVKKSLRRASFHHGTFGVEATDVNTGDPVRAKRSAAAETEASIVEGDEDESSGMPWTEEQRDRELSPRGYRRAYQFENLGGSVGDKNFIAVVHIDGNSMGKRVETLRETLKNSPWEKVRSDQRKFSEAIDRDFCAAYKEMCEAVSKWLDTGENAKKLKIEEKGKRYFPIRRVISAGDDMCFVTEGRIGVECARIFIEQLAGKVNEIDGQGYAACAGVAIVHQKYPFYRAYELAEMLCSNAKSYIVTEKDENASAEVSAIDWHIELGEIGESMEEIRGNLRAADGSHMEMRPYIVRSSDRYSFQKEKQYAQFRRLVQAISGNEAYARGKYKSFRDEIRRGQKAAENYAVLNLMQDPALQDYLPATEEEIREFVEGRYQKKSTIYAATSDGVVHSILFDAIEVMDTWLAIDEEKGE